MHLARWILAPTLAIVAGLGCAAASEPKPDMARDWPTSVEELFSANARDVMVHATSVKVYDVRRSSSDDKPPPAVVAEVAGFKAIAANTVSPKLVERLLSVLGHDETYAFARGPSRCIFMPAVAYQFTKGKDSVTLVFCFHCDDVIIWDASGHHAQASIIPGHDQLLALSEAALAEASPGR